MTISSLPPVGRSQACTLRGTREVLLFRNSQKVADFMNFHELVPEGCNAASIFSDYTRIIAGL